MSPVVAILSLLLHWLHSIYWAHAVYVNHIYSTFEETVKWEIKLGSPDLGLKKKTKPKQSELDLVQCLLGGPGRPFQKNSDMGYYCKGV